LAANALTRGGLLVERVPPPLRSFASSKHTTFARAGVTVSESCHPGHTKQVEGLWCVPWSVKPGIAWTMAREEAHTPPRSRDFSFASLKYHLGPFSAAPLGIKDGSTVLLCCDAQLHSWEMFSVATEWFPDNLGCLIIGESPGEDAAKYFYNQRRKVAVRTIILRELHRHRLVSEASLPAFRMAGFLFDHAIRCLLPADIIQHEADLSTRYESPRAPTATHLGPLLRQDSPVWVMGRIARNAVAALRCEFPRDTLEISSLRTRAGYRNHRDSLSPATCSTRVGWRWQRSSLACTHS